MATDKFGGHMTIKLSNGATMVMRAEGDCTIEATTMSSEAVINQNGSIDKVLSPKSTKLTCDFKDNNIDIEKLFGETGLNITIVEKHTGVTHLLSNGFFTGTPAANRKNGALTGITFEAARYRRIV